MSTPVAIDDTDGAQVFGGPQSVLKLDTLEGYLHAFTSALSKQSFQRIYIDAFAGSGSFKFGGSEARGFIAARPPTVHDGSAKRALAVTPAFDQLHFVDLNPANAGELQKLAGGCRGAHVHCADANQAVRKICKGINWKSSRGVIFLDPFNTVLEWDTLRVITDTHGLDVWYLAPLAGIYRNAPHKHSDLTPDKRATLTRIFGTSDWEMEFYKEPVHQGFFTELLDKSPIRVVDVAEMQAYMKRRLETVFPYVEKPRTLYGGANGKAPMFSLFFAMSNPSTAARRVALPIAKHLLKPKIGQFAR